MNKKEAIYAGLGGGLLFGVMQSFTVGPAQGISTGVFFGVAMGYCLHKFANSKLVERQTTLPEPILLPGERVLQSKQANLVIRPQDFGLDDFAFDGLFWIGGMKKQESLGGVLHLTNYRLIFKSHRYNRIRGMTSIFLPTIEQLENRTTLKIFRKFSVRTSSARVDFVIANVAKVISEIDAARKQLDLAKLAELQSHVKKYPAKCSDDLQPWTSFNRLNSLFNFGKKATSVTRAVTNPLAALSSKFVSELLDKTVTEKWQRVFQADEQGKDQQSIKHPAA